MLFFMCWTLLFFKYNLLHFVPLCVRPFISSSNSCQEVCQDFKMAPISVDSWKRAAEWGSQLTPTDVSDRIFSVIYTEDVLG